MSLIVKTAKPGELYCKIKKKISSDLIPPWYLLPNGYFAIVSPPENGSACFRCEIGRCELHFGIVPDAGQFLLPEVYSFYHSRLVETLLNNFENDFSEVCASSKRTFPDLKDPDNEGLQ